VEAALTYFRNAAPRHTQDEEQSLFPLLRAADQPEVRAALQAVEALERDHARADAWHAEVDAHFRRWLDSGSLTGAERLKLTEALAALRELYRRHIDVEDHQIFPLAQRLLSREQLVQIGGEMARRRGLERRPR
jgi:hemerythrin-like domain-containing protein